MEPEIIQFAASIHATEPDENEEIYKTYRELFRERNYFRHQSGFLVIKLSRSKKPFWGLRKHIIDALNTNFSYHVIFLNSASRGWAFSKQEVIDNTTSRAWNLESMGEEYKINSPLPDRNGFFGPKGCQTLLSRSET